MFKENVRLNKALGFHIKEVEDLRKKNAVLAEENDILSLHKVTTQHTIVTIFALKFTYTTVQYVVVVFAQEINTFIRQEA